MPRCQSSPPRVRACLSAAPVPCQVPPLRVRPADILDLERYFLRVISKRSGVKLTLTPEAERQLISYTFPNNITVGMQKCHMD